MPSMYARASGVTSIPRSSMHRQRMAVSDVINETPLHPAGRSPLAGALRRCNIHWTLSSVASAQRSLSRISCRSAISAPLAHQRARTGRDRAGSTADTAAACR